MKEWSEDPYEVGSELAVWNSPRKNIKTAWTRERERERSTRGVMGWAYAGEPPSQREIKVWLEKDLLEGGRGSARKRAGRADALRSQVRVYALDYFSSLMMLIEMLASFLNR